MSDTTETIEQQRDATTGRFLPGNSGNGGRKPGARNKLGEAFIEDLRDAWNEHGATALARCAAEEPGQFCRIVASLLPRDVNINMTAEIDVASFAERFRHAVSLLGNAPPEMRTIEHKATGNARNRR